MMVAIGLEVSLAELAAAARNWRLTTKAALANYLCIPAVTVSLLLSFHPADPMVPAGFLILAVCPGAPFGPACTGLARGMWPPLWDDGAAGRLVGHRRTSAIAPALAASVEDAALQVDSGQIVVTLLATQLAPFAWGRAYAAGHRG